MTGVNAEAIEAWNTVLFEKFVRFRDASCGGLASHGDEVLRRYPVRGAEGEAVGVDAAARFIECARNESRGVENVRFEVRDVQQEPLGGPFDRAFARFGAMPFDNPVAALRSVRRALRPDALFTLVVWRRREDDPWVHLAETVVRELVAVSEQHDAPTCGPGPFSMASADVVSTQLPSAGFCEPRCERYDRDITIGRPWRWTG